MTKVPFMQRVAAYRKDHPDVKPSEAMKIVSANEKKFQVDVDKNFGTKIPDGFSPIAEIKPEFKVASHVVSHSQLFTFFDTDKGVVKGVMQRYDRALGGPEKPKKTDIVFLSTDYKFLDKVTHFKTIT